MWWIYLFEINEKMATFLIWTHEAPGRLRGVVLVLLLYEFNENRKIDWEGWCVDGTSPGFHALADRLTFRSNTRLTRLLISHSFGCWLGTECYAPKSGGCSILVNPEQPILCQEYQSDSYFPYILHSKLLCPFSC